MPEPTAKPAWPWADRLREDIATLDRGDDIELMHNRFELRRLLADHLDLLEQLSQYSAAVAVLADENDRLGDRAAAAVAAVRHIDEMCAQWDYSYSWVAAEVRSYIASGCSAAAAPQPDLSSIAGILAADLDDQPVTFQGTVRHIEIRYNASVIPTPYLEIDLVDDLENTLTVTVPAGVYGHMDAANLPVEGVLLRVVGRTRRTVPVVGHDTRRPVGELAGGEPVYDLSDQSLPAEVIKAEAEGGAR